MKKVKTSIVLLSLVYLASSITFAEPPAPPAPQTAIALISPAPAVAGFEQTCALETSQHADLLNSVQALKDQLNLIPSSCKSDSTNAAFQSVDELKGASGKLQEFMSNQSLVVSDPTQFGMSAQTALNSLSSISSSIKSVASCSSKEKSTGFVTLLSSVSEVTMNLAPVLMAATIFLPALRVGTMATAALSKIPIAKALTAALVLGVGSKVVELVVDFTNDDAFNMEKNPEHRKLVLKSICDFQRIKKYSDALSSINSGKIDYKSTKEELEKRIGDLKDQYSKKKPKLAMLINKYEAYKVQIQNEMGKIQKARSVLAKLDKDMNLSEDKFYRCSVGSKVSNSDALLSGLVSPKSDTAKALLETIKENQRVIIDNFVNSKKEGVFPAGFDNRTVKLTACIAELDSWKKNSAIYLNELALQSQENSEATFLELQRDNEFLAWRDTFIVWRGKSKPLEEQSAFYSQIIGFMSASSDERQLISETELIVEVRNLAEKIYKDTLRNRSLAGKWLEHRIDKYEESVKSFTQSYSKLNYLINDLYFRAILAKFNEAHRSKDSRTIDYSTLQSEKNKIDQSYNLENLNPNVMAMLKGAGLIKNQCEDLGNLENDAKNASKLLNSAYYFCAQLQKNGVKRLSIDLDRYIVSKCWGKIGLIDDDSASGLAAIERSSHQRFGINRRLEIIQSRIAELKCVESSKKPLNSNLE